MKKALQELLTYIWIPFMLGFVLYIFQNQHDLPLAIVTLIAFSAIYTLVRVYFAHKDWRLLAAVALVIAGALGFVFLRPQGIALSINGQDIASSTVTFNEGSVSIYPAPGSDGKYSKGTVVTLTASPATGYELKSWTGTSNDIAATTTVIMAGKQQVTVAFESRPSLVINNLEVIGATVSFAEGSVSIEPPPDADGKYAKGTTVHLTANPTSGYDWITWAGTDGDTSNPTTVTMSSRKQVSVTFEHRFALVISDGQSNRQVVGSTVSFSEGSVSIDPAPGDDEKYAQGTVVNLKANPDPAYGFRVWSGTSHDTANPSAATINSDKLVNVTFEKRYLLKINKVSVNGATANVTGGSVSLSPAPLSDNRYASDTVVTLTAQSASGFRFDQWSDAASGNETSVAVTMDSAKNVAASFIKIYRLITSVNGTGGAISVSGGTYDTGSTVTLTASPSAGYRFDRWSGDASGNATTVTITINSDKNVTATFKKVFTLTTSVNPAGSGNVTPNSGSYDDGSVLTLFAQAAGGYRFDHWEGDASGNVTSANITMNANRTVTGFFKSLTP